MKKTIIFSLLALSLLFSQNTHANVDTVGIEKIEEYCNSTEPGNNLLKISFGTIGHHSDVRWYRLPFLNSGHISIGDGYHTTLVNRKINGCGCPTTPVGAGSYPAFAGWQIQLEHGQGINYFENIAWWPYTSGPWAYYWGERCTGGGCNPPGGSFYRVVSIPMDSGFTTAWFANTTTNVRFTPDVNGGVSTNPGCYPAVCGNTGSTATVPSISPIAIGSCVTGTPNATTSNTDSTGLATYDWSCTNGGGAPQPCKAYYKPLCVPTATDGCCDETRSPSQCVYSVKEEYKTQPTQDGPLNLPIFKNPADTNNIASECRPPVDGKPRIVCDADPFTTISSTLTSFTLPSSVTQKQGNCRVIFDAKDTCKPREDIITITAKIPDCDPSIKDPAKPGYCLRTSTETKVCVQLNDKFGNPIYNYATNQIVSILDKVESNTYYSQHNNGKDNTVYAPGTFTVVDNNYCAPICTVVDGKKCCPPPDDKDNDPKCTPTPPPPPPPTSCTPGTPNCPEVVCVETPTKPCDKKPICTPSILNNYCSPIGPVITVPGGGTINSNPNAVITVPGGGTITFFKKKACTGKLEVWNGQSWIDNGENIMYDSPSNFRVVINELSDPTCRDGVVKLDDSKVTATGGTLSGAIVWNTDGTFTATITRDTDSTPKTPRGVVVRAIFTQPGGLTYGLTSSATDFVDSPLTLAGERMKGVRIIGAAGTNITNFNLNNAGVIGEDSGANTVNMRNAMLKNVGLLTRGVVANSDRSINGVYYAEGDYTYTQLRSMSSGSFRTVIVRGNLTIDTAFPRHDSTDPIIGVIVIKKSDGSKGNIIIKNDVTSMRGVIFAEGSVYGETQRFGEVPLTKLVLKGSLFSRNTVGGSAEPDKLYISGGATTSDLAAAFLQDLNNIRNGYGCSIGGDSCYKNYPDPFIIDYENTLGDPPPGFTN